MSTDFQHAREALGRRLRELRGTTTQRALAAKLGWPQAKVSKLETGRQTATPDDLTTWATGIGRPEAAEELHAHVQGLETRTRSWRRQLSAGHRPVQDALTVEYERSAELRAWQGAMVVGMLQTPDYARHVFTGFAALYQSPRDIEAAVRARMHRQDLLYQSGRTFDIVMWEAALHAGVCPPGVLSAQLDRLVGAIGHTANSPWLPGSRRRTTSRARPVPASRSASTSVRARCPGRRGRNRTRTNSRATGSAELPLAEATAPAGRVPGRRPPRAGLSRR